MHEDLKHKALHNTRTRNYEADSHSPIEYVGFAVILASIASYALWELSDRDAFKKKIHAPLNDTTFVPFLLVAKDQISPTSAIFTLRRASSSSKEPYKHLWGGNGEIKVSSVEFKQPQLQIARAYTPLPPTKETDPTDLRFLIRKLEGGEVSNYLDGLRVGATVEVRGPKVEWQWEIPQGNATPAEVVFLAGGTGIAPAMQIVKSFMEDGDEGQDRRSRPKIHILWANRRREDCIGAVTKEEGERRWWQFGSGPKEVANGPLNPLVKELEDMVGKYEGDLKVDYLVDEERTLIDRRRILQSTIRKQNQPAVSSGKKLLLVSGPDGFVEHFAGPKAVKDGMQVQGPLGGVIGQLGLKGWTVVKL